MRRSIGDDIQMVELSVYNKLKAELQELKEATRWRKVEDELPEHKSDVLIRLKRGETRIVTFIDFTKTFECGIRHEYFDTQDITHWQPLPKFEADDE